MRPFSDVRVLLVGDVMLDRFVSGAVSRISPEAPVPVLHAAHELAMLGGAGNVARNLSALGAKSTFLSVAGDDEVADQLEVLLGQADGCTPFLLRDAARQSSLKTRFVARSHQLLRVDRETVRPLSGELLDRLLTRFRNALQDSDVVVLSDYAKGVLSAGAATKFIGLACEAGKPMEQPMNSASKPLKNLFTSTTCTPHSSNSSASTTKNLLSATPAEISD